MPTAQKVGGRVSADLSGSFGVTARESQDGELRRTCQRGEQPTEFAMRANLSSAFKTVI